MTNCFIHFILNILRMQHTETYEGMFSKHKKIGLVKADLSGKGRGGIILTSYYRRQNSGGK